MFVYIYIYIFVHICRHYTMIHIYRCFAGSDFCGRTHTHQTLVAFRLQTSTSSWWRRMRWSRLVFWPRAGADHMSSMLEKTPGTLETWDTFRIWCLPLDAEFFPFFFVSLLFLSIFCVLDGCQHHGQAATMGIGLSLLVAFLVLLATTCNWWSSSLGLICGLETLEKKTDSKGLHTPKMTACHRMSPKKGTISKRDYCTSSNPWFFTGIFVRFGGERPCPETKSWNEQLLQLGNFWAWKGVGRRVCRWPDDFLDGKVSPAPKLQGWNERFWHW